MRTGSSWGRRSFLRYSSGPFIIILVVSLSYIFKSFKSLQEHYDHDAGASEHDSKQAPESISITAPLDTSPFALNDVSNAPSSENSDSFDNLNNTSTPDSKDVTFNQPPAEVTNPHGSVTSRPQFDVVIAHHSEEPYYIRVWTDSLRSIPYVQELGMRIIIYTKGSMEPTAMKEISGADEVIQLPNVGREGGTYLNHLLSVYEDPPRFTLLAQAKLRKAQEEGSGKMSQWLQDRLRTNFGNQTGFMSMDRKHDVCYCGHCTDMGRDDFYPLWPQIYSMLQGKVCQRLEGHVLSFNGHFIVSRKRVLARPREMYQYLQSLVDAPADHWIHSEPEPEWFEKDKGKSIPSNPKFGHTLERLWHTIFNCDDPEHVLDCDMIGMSKEGPGGCSCRDAP